jgi:hypothetical protein
MAMRRVDLPILEPGLVGVRVEAVSHAGRPRGVRRARPRWLSATRRRACTRTDASEGGDGAGRDAG